MADRAQDDGTDQLARRLLRRVVEEVGDPWFREAYEGFNDGCVFCGSQDHDTTPDVCWHEMTCVWFDMHQFLGIPVSDYHKQRQVIERSREDS